MPLIIHHLHLSQSERIVWLLEELGLEYDLKVYDRDPKTALAPAEFKSLHPVGAAPVFEDTNVDPKVILAESSAIVEYIIQRYGNGRLARKPSDPDYPRYLESFHFVNSSLQPRQGVLLTLNLLGDEAKNSPAGAAFTQRHAHLLKIVDQRLADSKYLAGDDLTAADIMIVYTLTTGRGWTPVDLTPYQNILRYLQDISKRPAYQSAMKKGDPTLEPMIGAKSTLR